MVKSDEPLVPATDTRLDKPMREARALVEAGLATEINVQDGKVYVQGACAGCGEVGLHQIDPSPNAGNPWCPSCGGRTLVHLEMTELDDFENGLCRVSTSPIVHSVAMPYGQHPLCMPGCKVGRMRPAKGADEPTCQRCIKARAGEASYGVNLDSEAIPLRPASVGDHG